MLLIDRGGGVILCWVGMLQGRLLYNASVSIILSGLGMVSGRKGVG